MIRLGGMLAAVLTVNALAQPFTAQFPIERLHFSPFGGALHFNINPGHRLVLEGEENGQHIHLTVTALNQTKQIVLPTPGQIRTLTARVVEEREIVNGLLDQVARLWYACAIETRDVYLFGEEVDFYFNGQIVGQTRLWEAGVDGALPGIIMPATFLLGARYYQNQAITALDGAENLASGLTISTPAGSFSNCVQIRETDGLRPELGSSLKTYAPGVGVINDDDHLFLQEFGFGNDGVPPDGDFIPFSHHPFLPLSPGRRLFLQGTEAGEPVTQMITVLDEVQTLALTLGGDPKSVPTRVVQTRKSIGGQSVAVLRDFYAQCIQTGDVWWFGREVESHQEGLPVNRQGTWLAGVDGAQPGIILPANLALNARYVQAYAPDVFHPQAQTAELNLSVMVPAGTFTGCLRILVLNILGDNPDYQERIYAPGIGLIRMDGTAELTSFDVPDAETGAPMLSVQEAVQLTWPLTENAYQLQSSPNLKDWLSVPGLPTPFEGLNRICLPRDRDRQYYRLAPAESSP